MKKNLWTREISSFFSLNLSASHRTNFQSVTMQIAQSINQSIQHV